MSCSMRTCDQMNYKLVFLHDEIQMTWTWTWCEINSMKNWFQFVVVGGTSSSMNLKKVIEEYISYKKHFINDNFQDWNRKTVTIYCDRVVYLNQGTSVAVYNGDDDCVHLILLFYWPASHHHGNFTTTKSRANRIAMMTNHCHTKMYFVVCTALNKRRENLMKS